MDGAARPQLHEFAAAEGFHIGGRKLEPLAAPALLGEALVPIGFDTVGVISADCVHELQILRELHRNLPGSPSDDIGFADLVALLAADLHQGEVNVAGLEATFWLA
jgi:hypothetical protein